MAPSDLLSEFPQGNDYGANHEEFQSLEIATNFELKK